jgi:hypothetical protein
MTLEKLNNLVKIGQIHPEPADAGEFNGLVQSARDRLQDIDQNKLSAAGQFDLVYNAAHALALAALRSHGFRSTNRYQVFQCLVHTVNLSAEKTQIFALCHQRRNVAEYEGNLEIEEALLSEFIKYTNELLKTVEALDPIDRVSG